MLIVLTTFPMVPLGDQLLVALSVGVPIGLGVYFAWVNPDWSARAKIVGFVGAAGSALLGAWLGFNVVEGLFALVPIAGAIAGSNLTLLALDIAWDRQARDRFAVVKATLEARPSTGLTGTRCSPRKALRIYGSAGLTARS